ncbi:hypothetical protein BKA64DRAFT_471706 [Cadophora sp. MPI-SDFR-AT-0126]|nr:hypothetical protein BKA64DRAFT_471706 [Leotiomycetes sp. MPI-SDFR-AT-0126]
MTHWHVSLQVPVPFLANAHPCCKRHLHGLATQLKPPVIARSPDLQLYILTHNSNKQISYEYEGSKGSGQRGALWIFQPYMPIAYQSNPSTLSQERCYPRCLPVLGSELSQRAPTARCLFREGIRSSEPPTTAIKFDARGGVPVRARGSSLRRAVQEEALADLTSPLLDPLYHTLPSLATG